MSTIRLALAPRAGGEWRTLSLTGDKGKDRTVLVIPGEDVLVRWIEVQGRTPQQVRAAALAKLAPELAQDLGECIAALGETRNGLRQVAIMSRATADDILKSARARRLAPDAMIPDVCLLAPPLEADTVIAHSESGDVLVRAQDAAFVAQPDLLETFLDGATRSETTLEAEAARTLRAGAATLPDFLPAMPAARAASGDAQQPRRIAWAMAGALVLAIAAPWANTIRLDLSTRAMEREADRIAAAALPGAARIRNARAQLSAALMAHTNGRQRIETAAVILGELTAQPDLAITRLDADADTPVVRASLTAPSADAALSLRNSLAARNYSAEQTASDAPNGLTAIDLSVRANP